MKRQSINPEHMDDSSWKNREPWVVVDPDFNREWLLPEPLQYYVAKGKSGNWFVCNRWLDIPVPGTDSPTGEEAIRQFYKWCERPLPTGEKLPKLPVRVANQG